MEKKDFVKLITDQAVKDAKSSTDDFSSVSEEDTLIDIADDAWYNTGIPAIEWKFIGDPQSPYAKMDLDIHEAIDKYNLSSVYKETFVKALIKKYGLRL